MMVTNKHKLELPSPGPVVASSGQHQLQQLLTQHSSKQCSTELSYWDSQELATTRCVESESCQQTQERRSESAAALKVHMPARELLQV